MAQALGVQISSKRIDGTQTFYWIVAILVILMVVGPLIPVLYQGIVDAPIYQADKKLTLDNFWRLVSAPDVGRMALNTLYIAVLATVIAQVVGAGMAILMGRTNLPGRTWLGELFLWPLYVGHLVIAFGWLTMYGPSGFVTIAVKTTVGIAPWDLYTLTGMGVVAGVTLAPMTYLLCLGMALKADGQMEDAARSVGASPARALWSVTIPLMRPALVYSAMLNFVISIELLSIPLLFGSPVSIQTITTYIYQNGLRAIGMPDYGLVGAAAIILLVIVSFMIWLQNRLVLKSERFVSVRGKAARISRLNLGWAKWPLTVLVCAYVFFFVVLVVGGVMLRASVSFLTPLIPISKVLTWANFLTIWNSETFMRAITNSILISTIGGAIGVAVVLMVVLVAMRSNFRYRRVLEYVALYPRAVPGIIAGLGFFYMMIWLPGFDQFRGTIWIIIAAFVMRYLPLGFNTLAPAIGQISNDLDKGARSVGASWWTASRQVVIPLIKPAIFGAFCLLFIQFFKEYVTASFLTQSGSEIIGTSMLALWNNGENGAVSALATIQIVITLVFVIAARRILGVKMYG
ncbi:ABC transporter permease [Pseudochelatococcus lubricantis]|uniref:ABC transporter permease n=1 Tax=Pseudochelatococcus lubricantis TaxID=1538102 RepID=UPI0035EBAE80